MTFDSAGIRDQGVRIAGRLALSWMSRDISRLAILDIESLWKFLDRGSQSTEQEIIFICLVKDW